MPPVPTLLTTKPALEKVNAKFSQRNASTSVLHRENIQHKSVHAFFTRLQSHILPAKVAKDMYACKEKKDISSENLSQLKLLAKICKNRFQEKNPEC